MLKYVRWIKLPSFEDVRGNLTAIESLHDIPFVIKRVFYMYNISEDRGGHAHIDTDQVIIALNGSLKLKLTDGLTQKNFLLNDPQKGLYIPRKIFIELKDISKEAIILVLTNTSYDVSKSIRNLQQYLDYISNTTARQ